MNKVILICILGFTFFNCMKQTDVIEISRGNDISESVNNNAESTQKTPTEIPVDDLSLDGLVGMWILLNSEGEIDPGDKYLLIVKLEDKYIGEFSFNNYQAKSLVSKIN